MIKKVLLSLTLISIICAISLRNKVYLADEQEGDSSSFENLRECPFNYTVRSGDTYYNLARKFNTTIVEMQNLNRLPDIDRINIGDTLRIPCPLGRSSDLDRNILMGGLGHMTFERNASLSDNLPRNMTVGLANAGSNMETTEADEENEESNPEFNIHIISITITPAGESNYTCPFTHTIHEGETLDEIASRYNLTPEELISNNNLEEPVRLTQGMDINIPCPEDFTDLMNNTSIRNETLSGDNDEMNSDTMFDDEM